MADEGRGRARGRLGRGERRPQNQQQQQQRQPQQQQRPQQQQQQRPQQQQQRQPQQQQQQQQRQPHPQQQRQPQQQQQQRQPYQQQQRQPQPVDPPQQPGQQWAKFRGRGVDNAPPPAQSAQHAQSAQPVQSTQSSVSDPSVLSQQMSRINIGEEAKAGGEQISRKILHTRPSELATKIGSSGRKVQFQANYFDILKKPDWALFQYRVDFQPDEERTSIKKGMMKAHKDVLGPYMFDGTCLFVLNRLPSDTMELFSPRLKNDESSMTRILIKFSTQVLGGDPQYIQFFNIILRRCIDTLDLQLVGRNYYDAAAKVSIREFNFEIWPGIITSIKQHENSLLLNVDISHKIMRKETAFDMLMKYKQKFRNDWQENFEKAIVGTTVITLYNNKTYRIDEVNYTLSPASTFEKQNAQISFQKYYRDRYSINIANMNQPLLVSIPTARDVRGGRSGSIILVPELCNLTGLTDEMRSDFNLMRAVADHTRVRPSQRMDNYYSFLKRMIQSSGAKEVLNMWNVQFSNVLTKVPGRIFENEEIRMGNNKSFRTDSNADWKRCFRDAPMKYSVPISKWAIIYPNKNSREIDPFVKTLIHAANGIKYSVSQPIEWVELPDDRPHTYVHAIENVMNKCSPHMIMCIVPNARAERYGAIKRKCYVDRAIPNQVVLAKNLRNKDLMSVASKIAIQMNCKLGGVPWSVDIPFRTPAMIVGFDVCHDTTSNKLSFGAMVASLNSDYSKYYSAVKAHETGVELSDYLSTHLSLAMVRFGAINRCLPSRIILFRDGVGDGNIEYVYTHEVQLIKRMLKGVYGNDNPPLTVVVVSKRINTRLFFEKENPPPGSVVDDVITVPEKYDFFLVSQSVRQGTVTPTSYNVIYDQSGLTPDHIQRLTYKMTHMYYNFSGTIRVPAPCQYAHKLAFMAGQFLHTNPNEGMNDILYFL